MKKIIEDIVKNKKVLILGFGREGKSTLRVLQNVGGYDTLAVADSRNVENELPDEVLMVTGENYLDNLDDYDVVFKSPGVVLPKSIEQYKCTFTSETDIFIKAYGKQIIGITGTKGKSTTSSLLNHVLKYAGKDVLFAGNIGIPVFEIEDQVEASSIIVLELSCHQLEYATCNPHIAVLLNVYEDHLDHYGTREKYAQAKRNIYLYQTSQDYLYTTKEVTREFEMGQSIVRLMDLSLAPVESLDAVEGVSLRGEHNLLNATFVYEIARTYGVSKETFIEALKTFESLPHRLEYVCTKNGVDYYDDSISTTVKSSISAVKSIKNSAVLLLGGMERNIEYDELVDFVINSNLKYVICMYASGKRIYDMCVAKSNDTNNHPAFILCDDLKQAMVEAKRVAAKGDAVILSPASASYGYFKNFEERGDVFKELTKN